MKKYCENCGKELMEGADVCTNCGKKVPVTKNNNKKNKMPVWAIILIVVLCIGVFGAAISGDDEKEKGSSNPTNNKTENKEDPEYKVNEPFKFNDLEITIGDTISFTTIKNQFSDHDGKDVIKVPVTIKNIDDEENKLNMFYVKYFGTQGTELDTISTYFMDDCVEFAGELMPDASYTKYFYFLYDGNGIYTIKFDNWGKKINFKLDITK